MATNRSIASRPTVLRLRFGAGEFTDADDAWLGLRSSGVGLPRVDWRKAIDVAR
jgi:hypothetical protein